MSIDNPDDDISDLPEIVIDLSDEEYNDLVNRYAFGKVNQYSLALMKTIKANDPDLYNAIFDL